MEQLGTYHLANNPQLYEIQRPNSFQFLIPNLGTLLRAGAIGYENNAYITNGDDIIRVSCHASGVPHFSQSTIEVKRFNSTLKYAGTPKFDDLTIKLHDYIGAETKEALMAWQNLSYNIRTEKVGSLDVTNYKRDCYLQEYTSDTRLVRQWIIRGAWISSISEDDYDWYNGDERHGITATITYDRAEIDQSGLE